MKDNTIKLNESAIRQIVAESLKAIINEAADNMGNGTPNFFQKMFNTKGNRAYNFRKDLGNNADYNSFIDSNVKKASGRGKDSYDTDYIDDNDTIGTMKRSGKYKGVNAHAIAKDYYGQRYNSGYGDAKAAQRQRDAYNTQQMNAQYKTEIENEIRRAFNQPHVDWKKVDELKKQLAKYSSLEYANNLVSGLQQGNNRQSANNAKDIEDAQGGNRQFGKFRG